MGFTQKCDHCGKALRNFRGKRDWEGRKMHRTCWKTVNLLLEIKEMVKEQTVREDSETFIWEIWKRQSDALLKEIREMRKEGDERLEKIRTLQNSVDFYKRLDF